MAGQVPPQEVHIDLELVNALVRDQAPQYASLAIAEGKSGWDNCLYRLGHQLQIRLPRRAQALQNQNVELTWLTKLAHLSVPLPTPLFVGKAAANYPWPWTIVPWFEGETADRTHWHEPTQDLIPFFQALHGTNVDSVPHNPFRSCHLREKETGLLPRMDRLQKQGLLRSYHEDVWQAAIRAPEEDKVLIHGDLHPRNVLVHQNKLAAVLDWGDLCLGERAVDLASMWMIPMAHEKRRDGLKTLKVSSQTVLKSRGWALFYGVLFTDIGLSGDDGLFDLGIQILDALD